MRRIFVKSVFFFLASHAVRPFLLDGIVIIEHPHWAHRKRGDFRLGIRFAAKWTSISARKKRHRNSQDGERKRGRNHLYWTKYNTTEKKRAKNLCSFAKRGHDQIWRQHKGHNLAVLKLSVNYTVFCRHCVRIITSKPKPVCFLAFADRAEAPLLIEARSSSVCREWASFVQNYTQYCNVPFFIRGRTDGRTWRTRLFISVLWK